MKKFTVKLCNITKQSLNELIVKLCEAAQLIQEIFKPLSAECLALVNTGTPTQTLCEFGRKFH